MKKFLILASALALSVITAHAGIGLGSTLSECTQSWGQVLKVRGQRMAPTAKSDTISNFKGTVWKPIASKAKFGALSIPV
jgi:hypothetical protein